MNLAQRGFAVVNFTYRLAPEYRFPSSLEDTCMVFDTNNIFAVGDSAGAHLLGLFSGMCTNPEYAKNFSFHAPKLGAALVKNKVPHEFHYYGDEEHELGHVFMLRIKEEDARICNDEECDYFRKMMR
ncbi:MAG: alpha/beta hydrolase [Lachnospiraceae bacterium]|nr:alpha/beta hydrolase [Lachnospiraceae bacterium]